MAEFVVGDFKSLVDHFASPGSISRVQRTVPAISNGVRQDPVETITAIEAVVRPAPGSELKFLGEGFINREVLFCWTSVALQTQASRGGIADQIIYRGNRYTVTRICDSQDQAGVTRATIVKDLL